MSDRSERRKTDWAIAALVGVAILLMPILYVLSVGPAVAISDHGYLSDRTCEIAYGPLVFVAGRSSAFAAFLEWYVGVWR